MQRQGGEQRKCGLCHTTKVLRINALQSLLPFFASRSIFRASILSHFRYLGRGAARHQGRGLVVWGEERKLSTRMPIPLL